MYSQEDKSFESYANQKDLLPHENSIFTNENYAGFWLRFAAYCIDAIVAMVFLFVATSLFGTGMAISPSYSDQVSPAFWALIGIFYLGIILYFPLMESSKWQATLGKRAVGIRVTDLDGRRIDFGRALGRLFAKIISGIILYIGFIMAGFTDRKQGLHDIIAGTLVIKDNEKVIQ
jgi:uncharacterized RDD family membrane protein YckC